MGEQLHFSMDGEFLTAIARDWFWNMDKPYKKCEELLLSCMTGGNEEEKRHVCQDIIEGRKKLVGVNEFELVDDNVHVRSLGQKVEELQHKMLVNQISHIKSIAHKWYLVTGVPEKVRMSYDNYLLWQRLAEFCATV